MKTPFKLLAPALAVLAISAAQAQPAASVTTPPSASPSGTGLLGHRYAELSIGAIDPHGTSDLGFTSDIGVNLPIQPGLDVGFGYGYSRFNTDVFGGAFEQKFRDHTAHVSATAYSDFRGTKPFFGAALGHQWSRARLNFSGRSPFEATDDESLWALGAGVEIPFGRITVTPSVSYQDGFHSDSAAGFAYSAEANTWFTRTLGGFAEVTYSDPTGGGTQAWTYRLGARLRF